jgi:thiosulfate dehydrogenase [quinone] large subunit
MDMSTIDSAKTSSTVLTLEDPPIIRFLFGDVRLSWIWLIIRLYAGYKWVSAGWSKITNPAWVGTQAGTGLTSFVDNALKQTGGAHPNVTLWYAWFLQHVILPVVPVWGVIVAFGEFLVGVALILGILTGLAAFFGGFMNVNYMLAGSLSINPILFVFATWLVLAWKTAGWIGLDRWVLPALGAPWRPSKLFRAGGK